MITGSVRRSAALLQFERTERGRPRWAGLSDDGQCRSIPPATGTGGSLLPNADAVLELFVVLATDSRSRRHLDTAALEQHRMRVAAITTLDELHEALHQLQPDVAVIDAGLVAGRRALLALVRSVPTPMIAVAVGDTAARVALLLAGADDCLPAGYSVAELAARVFALGRRTRPSRAPQQARTLHAGPLRLDLRSRTVWMDRSLLALTALEFDLLSCLVRHRGEVLSRERLLAEVWGYTSGAAATVTVHVRRLRSKIESDPRRPELIQTVWGLGYRFRADEPTEPR